jgi:DNA polymerase I-like protein with 3'-5' exonuclease and polymerase domains
MRDDSVGLFWQDLPRAKGAKLARVMPPIPETGWEVSTEFPNLSAAKALSVDVETYDPDLLTKGPGWARGVGHIVGIAVGTQDGYRRYFPMRHTIDKHHNLDPDHVLLWAKDTLEDNRAKVGANLTYDVGWLREEGIYVRGPLYDVEFAEALLSEAATVNLDDLGERYLSEGKQSNTLYEWCAAYYGGKENGTQRKNIYRAPPTLVGPYAEGDVDLPFRILDLQWPELARQGLLDLFSMENRLIPLMIEMRFAGVRIDIEQAEKLRDKLLIDLKEIDEDLYQMVGFEVNTNAGASMARVFEHLGLPITRTKKGAPSFTKGILDTVDHPVAELIRKKKAREKLIGTFIEGYLLESHINNRVYGSFNQLRGDESGARSGRFSSSNPNLQNIPFRSKIGKLIRNCFIPDEGHEQWIKADYGQIEYRGLAHYAVGPGADEVRRRYREDPKTDFHVAVQELVRDITGQFHERPLIKNINFGATYGMGIEALSGYLKLPIKQAKELYEAIHKGAPFLRSTMDATMKEASDLGYITTILGRRSRFDQWVPGSWNDKAKPLPYEKAVLYYVNPKRAYLHKALNRRLQGSAADLIKMAMLMCWEGGLFAETGVPRLQVHDELDFSDPGGKEEVFKQVYYIMETAIPFNVPIQVGQEVGPSWGEVE